MANRIGAGGPFLVQQSTEGDTPSPFIPQLTQLADDRRRYQLGAVDFIPNLLITTILASVALRDPTFAQKQDLSHPKIPIQVQQPANRLPLTAKPFVPVLPEQVQRPLFLPDDTSQGTPLPLYADLTILASKREFQTLQRPLQVYPDTSFRNEALLAPSVATPFSPVDFSNIPWQKWLPADTSQGTPLSLLSAPVATPFAGYVPPSLPTKFHILSETSQGTPAPMSAAPFLGFVPPNTPPKLQVLPDTSQGTPKVLTQPPFTPVEDVFIPWRRDVVDTSQGTPLSLLTAPVATPFFNESYNVIRPPFNVVDTSQGTPLSLLNAPVFPPFFQSDFPSPIEYRFKYWPTNDPQIYPEFIPPAPPTPTVIEIIDGVSKKKHKHPTREIGELVDEVVRDRESPPPTPEIATNTILPSKKYVVIPVIKPVIEALPLPEIDELEPEDDSETIAYLISIGLL